MHGYLCQISKRYQVFISRHPECRHSAVSINAAEMNLFKHKDAAGNVLVMPDSTKLLFSKTKPG
jgi:uncharacterized membrane protein YoaT (DUF817 family)